MDINKKLNEVEQFINDKRTESEKRINMMETLIEKAKAEKVEAERESKIAFDSMDIDNYHSAQKKIRNASDEVAMYTAKLGEIKSEQLMTKDQYLQFADDVINGLEELNNTEKSKLIRLIDEQIIPVGDSVSNTINRANELLDTMVYDFLKLKDGSVEYVNTRKTYNDRTIAGLVGYIKDSGAYKRGAANE